MINSIPTDEWDLKTTLCYVHSIVEKFSDTMPDRIESYVENAYDLMLKVRESGESDYEWNSAMANVCFNLQLYQKAVFYQKAAIRINGGDPHASLEGLYEGAMEKLSDDSVTDLTDEQILSLYSQYC
jgi:hypothetical protein